jgi:hypothetical protein
MTASPQITPVPLAPPLMMSSTTLWKPTPSQLPQNSKHESESESSEDEQEDLKSTEQDQTLPLITRSTFKLPPLRVHLDDLLHPATNYFITLTNATTLLPNAINAILTYLYPKGGDFPIPSTRSVTLILRSTMGGVAYTTGLDLDDLHKEIHFSLGYIKNCCAPDDDARRRDEIVGVVTHEMVHCYQYNGFGTANGGLIEGIADFVRLKAGLSPPHWNRKDKPSSWDQGYQHTAYFLEWIEERFGEGSVARINLALKGARYKERRFWNRLFGRSIKELFGDYSAVWDEKFGQEGGKEQIVMAERTKRKEENPLGDDEESKTAADEEGMVVVEKEDGAE